MQPAKPFSLLYTGKVSGTSRQRQDKRARFCTFVQQPSRLKGMSEVSPDLLAEVATLYFEHDFTQAKIAKRLGTSRSTVSRLLKQARESGVVSIRITYPYARDSLLETQLLERFGLRAVRVLRGGTRTADEVLNGAGKLAARLLEDLIGGGMILGVSYGRSIAATIRNLEPAGPQELTVVQLLGALGSDNPLIEGADLARELAGKYNATYRYLYAPLVAKDPRTRDLIVSEPLVKDVLSVGEQADIALVGIGALQELRAGAGPSFIWKGYLSESDLRWLEQAGAVGNMCAQFFAADGSVLEHSLNERSISVGLAALKKIPTVLSVACGQHKVAAILGALRGRFTDILVTDNKTAAGVLDLSKGLDLAS